MSTSWVNGICRMVSEEIPLFIDKGTDTRSGLIPTSTTWVAFPVASVSNPITNRRG
jgi:hypothetical protein